MPHGPLRLVATMVAASLLVVGSVVPASAAGGPNLSPGKATQASSSAAGYAVSAVNDGDQATYWESANNSFPQWARIDLGTATSVDQIVLKVPAPTAWQTRTQTLSVQGGADGSSYSTVVASANYTFNPATGNTVTINFGAATHRYWRVNVTANTGWPAAQISEFELYGPSAGGDNQAPTAPANLAYTQPSGTQIQLTWTASTDNVGVTGYDIYANNQLRSSVGNVTTYTDTQPATATVTYYVKAKDAAGNQSPNSNSVTRNGTGDPGSNLAIGKEIAESGHVHTFVAANANDNNLATYWEANSGAFPNTLTVKLGANASVSSVVVKLNPDSSWGTRTQNIQVLGREQSATTYQNLVSAATYTFNPASGGNSVKIDFSATVADVQLKFASNSGAPGGQVAEFQVIGVPAPNPDLTVTNLSWTPASPTEANAITLSATVRNSGTAASGADSVNLYLGGTLVGTPAIPALPVNGTATVTHNIGTRGEGSYTVSARVDADNTVFEQNEDNNT
jgi:hypothetical protein